MESTMPIRAAHKSSGREALASFQRARFHVIVCRPHLGDIASSHWIRMIHSGKFGYAATPVIVLCDSIELQELGPMVDENTLLVPENDNVARTAALEAIQAGASKATVLVVEDEILAAAAAGEALDKAYRVDLAYDGMDCSAYVARKTPHGRATRLDASRRVRHGNSYDNDGRVPSASRRCPDRTQCA